MSSQHGQRTSDTEAIAVAIPVLFCTAVFSAYAADVLHPESGTVDMPTGMLIWIVSSIFVAVVLDRIGNGHWVWTEFIGGGADE